MRMSSDAAADALNVSRKSLLFGSEFFLLQVVPAGQFLPDGDFFSVREARNAHGSTREIALGVGRHLEHSVRRDTGLFLMALRVVESAQRSAQDQKENKIESSRLHKSWRMAAR